MNWNDASTNCDRAREIIADALLSRRGAALDSDVERHVAGCAACRAYRTEVESMWADLGRLSAPASSPYAHSRFMAALRREIHAGRHVLETPMPAGPFPTRRFLALAASLVVAALLGFGTATWRANTSASAARVAVAPDSTPQFLLLLYDSRSAGPPLTRERVTSIIAEYNAWASSLAAAGQLVSAEKLSDDPSDWLGGTVDTRNGERIGGFFLIRARDLDEARRIARQCPHLKYGGRIELRPIQST